MSSRRKSVFLGTVLALLIGFGFVASLESRGWSKCVEGTYAWDEWHCYLGIAADCSECWVI